MSHPNVSLSAALLFSLLAGLILAPGAFGMMSAIQQQMQSEKTAIIAQYESQGGWTCQEQDGSVLYNSGLPSYCKNYYPGCDGSQTSLPSGCEITSTSKHFVRIFPSTATYMASHTATTTSTSTSTSTSMAANPPPETPPESDDQAPQSQQASSSSQLSAQQQQLLVKAEEEMKLAQTQATQFRITMEQMKTKMLETASAFRNGNTFSMDSAFLAGGISGEKSLAAANGRSPASGISGGGEENPAAQGRENGGFYGLAGKKSSVTEAAPKAEKDSAPLTNGKAMEDPWLSYMAKTSSDALKSRLKLEPSLRDKLRKRLEELKQNPAKAETVAVLEGILKDAEKEAANTRLDDLKPMSVQEAFALDQEPFSMDANETKEQIHRMLSELDENADAQFLPTISLFERVSIAYRRSLKAGDLRTKP